MNQESLKRILFRGFIGIYIVLGVYTELGLMEILPLKSFFLQDFLIYLRATRDAVNGVDPYLEKRIGAAFLYPPQSLLFFEAFAHIPNRTIMAGVFFIVNIAMLIAMTYGVIKYFKLSQADAWFLYPLALGFAPFLELLHIGQVNQFIEFGLFLMFAFATQTPWLAGLGLGWAAMLKVTPAVFLAYLFLSKKWKAIGATIGTALAFSVLTWMRYGRDFFFSYIDAFRSVLSQFPDGLESHSFFAVVNRFVDIHAYTTTIQTALNIYLLLIIASGLLSYYMKDMDLYFVVLGIGVTLTPNVLWYHHYIFLLLPLFVLMCRFNLDLRIVTWCLLGFIIIQLDRFYLTGGLLIHLFGHLTIVGVIGYQISLARKQLQQKRFYDANSI